jgi:hypothetical protein
MKRTPVLGDVYEIGISRRLAYFQYVRRHERLGALIRVLKPTFDERPAGFAEVVDAEDRFLTFFPLAAAVSKRIVTLVSNEMIPSRYRSWPRMRAPGRVTPSGVVETWWIWDGVESIQVAALSDEERHLSIKAIINDTALIEQIASNWTPEDYG